jgi:hypothetical protein
MSQRSRILAFGSVAVLVVVAVVAAIVVHGTPGQILGFVLIALGLVLATALVFLEVGLSEDRERAREEAQKPPRPAGQPGPASPRRRAGPRLPRMRGSRRRLS